MKMDILNEKPISIVEAKEILEKRSKESELSFEQQNALQHVQKFARVDLKKAKKLAEDLSKIEGITELQKVKLIDLMPKKEEEVKLILQQDKKSIISGKEKEILQILSA